MAFLDRLRPVTGQLHHDLRLKPDEPIIQIVIAGYQKDYGPEVWTLDYKLRQEELRADYLQTQIERPRYQQLWPPDKGQSHSTLEISYPGVQSNPSLLESMRNDPRLQRIAGAGPGIADVQQAILAGDTRKVLPADAIAFMRAAVSALAGNGSDCYAIAAIGEHTGFTWIVRPKGPAEEKTERPSGAPTLGRP